ncbi:MAG: hypothetical protein ACWA6Y_10250 [Polaromonas sp.]
MNEAINAALPDYHCLKKTAPRVHHGRFGHARRMPARQKKARCRYCTTRRDVLYYM